MENMKKLNKKKFITKILISTKLSNPIPESRGPKLVFITIPRAQNLRQGIVMKTSFGTQGLQWG